MTGKPLIGDGGYITTFTGEKFVVQDPDESMVHIKDIAHSLSQTPRFGGHLRPFYSVAQHSLIVSVLAEQDGLAKLGLLHDAAEAYFGDVPRPIKVLLPRYEALIHRAEQVIYERFGISQPTPNEMARLKHWDNVALVWEATNFLSGDLDWMDIDVGKLDDGIGGLVEPGEVPEMVAMPPWAAEKEFLNKYNKLFDHE